MLNLLLHSQYFTVFGIKIYLYGVMITLGIIAGITLAFWTFKKKGLKTEHIVNLGLIAIPCAILGARIYYCTFIDNTYDFLSFFDITRGGLAVYGAIIGGALGVLVYCLIKKINFLQVADGLVPSLAIGQCLGRIGCYFGGCCYGEPTDIQVFPISVQIDGVWRLATFFYESFATLLICVALIILIRYINGNGFVFCSYFFLYGIARFFIEGVRGDSLYFLGLRVSQALSLVLIIASIGVAIYLFFYHKKKGIIPPLFSSKSTNTSTQVSTINANSNSLLTEENANSSVVNESAESDVQVSKNELEDVENAESENKSINAENEVLSANAKNKKSNVKNKKSNAETTAESDNKAEESAELGLKKEEIREENHEEKQEIQAGKEKVSSSGTKNKSNKSSTQKSSAKQSATKTADKKASTNKTNANTKKTKSVTSKSSTNKNGTNKETSNGNSTKATTKSSAKKSSTSKKVKDK